MRGHDYNLGTALETHRSVTVRVIARQYSFTPQCLLLPTRSPDSRKRN
jgi:cytochrome c oxidase subunit II